MSEIKKDSKDYIGYDYKELTASGERASFYLDCYQSFGWGPDERMETGKGKLVLKRERKIMNKAELTRLQRHFEACIVWMRSPRWNGLRQQMRPLPP